MVYSIQANVEGANPIPRNIGMDRAIDSISTPGDSIPILDYAIEGLMWLVQAWLALLAAALINGFTGNGFRVRITSPGE